MTHVFAWGVALHRDPKWSPQKKTLSRLALMAGAALQLACVSAHADPVAPASVNGADGPGQQAGHDATVELAPKRAHHMAGRRHLHRQAVVRPSQGVAGAAPRAGAPGLADPGPQVTNPAYAAIDRLRLRYIVTQPSVTDTVFGDAWGAKEVLASYGIGFNALLTGSFEHNVLHEPTTTFGSQHYIGQKTEFDTSASYAALTFDLGKVGLQDGLFTAQACAGGGTYHIYPRGVRLCSLYVDQPFLNNKFDLQFGIIANSNEYANPLVGGSVATGSIGPSANILTELGLAAGGEGAPAVNLVFNPVADLYNRAGVQRSTSPNGYVYDGEVANPAGLTFSEPRAGAMFIDEIGYKHFATADSKYTWLRAGAIDNTSQYTDFVTKLNRRGGAGMYALADQQLLQFDPTAPRRGLYAGASFMYADPAVYTYSNYYEARAYVVGPFNSRPKDQITFVVNRTVAGANYLQSVAGAYPNELYSNVNSFTLIYGYRVTPGLYLNAGLNYTIHPSVTFQPAEGNPLLFRTSLAAYF